MARPRVPSEQPRGARSSRQRRSRETLERILEAAEALLETREFDQLTMAELARHAGCAVGTVYGRLPNKESLLLCLHERYLESGHAASARAFEGLEDAPLEQRVDAICALAVECYAANPGVTRAITNYLFLRPSEELGAEVAGLRRGATAAFKRAASFLAQRVDPRVHSDPQSASEFALLAATDVAQSRLAFGDRSGLRINYSSKALEARIAAQMLAYLRHG